MSLRPESGDSYPSIRDTPGGYPPSPIASDHGSQHSRIISAPTSLSHKVKQRRAEYVRKKQTTIKVGSWNVASIKGTEKDLGAWFVDGLGVKGLSENLAGLSVESGSVEGSYESQIESVAEQEQRQRKKINTLPKNDVPAVPSGNEIGLYVLGLQEIVDINSATQTIRQYTDTLTTTRWIHTMEQSLPHGYVKVAEQQLLGLLLLIYASPEVASMVGSVSTTSVGTGLLGYMGNKGAASARLTLGETTTLVFVNCHLSAGADKAALERRNWDVSQIVSRTKFSPITDNDEVVEDHGDSIGEEDFAFWFGDLNYRIADVPGDDVRRLLLLHTRNEYDINNKSKRKIDSELGYVSAPMEEVTNIENKNLREHNSPQLDPKEDPASLHTALQSLLPHDELRTQQKLQKAFHDGWREGELNFLPTYKYDVGSIGMFDSGEKKRGPSWCDRILYRTRRDILQYRKRAKEAQEARKKDKDMQARGLEQAASEDDVLFDYDPDADGADGYDYDEADDNFKNTIVVQTQEGHEDTISLDHYVSHQRVLSSDHKPLDAVFTLTYDAVDSDLKAKVHQEVARELDKAENEGRPGVTLVVDDLSNESAENADHSLGSGNPNGIYFGNIRYGVPRTCGLTLANTGSVPALFGFIDEPTEKLGSSGHPSSWLHVDVQLKCDNTTKAYTLAPGESAEIKLTVEILDLESVSQLNAGEMSIEDVLVLRIHEGRDHFISIKGEWLPSCLCRTLDELTVVRNGGVRGGGLHDAHEQTSAASDNDHARLSAPHELFALIESIQDLVERSLAEWGMTAGNQGQPPWARGGPSAGWPFQSETWTQPAGMLRAKLCALVREALDTASPVPDTFPVETPALVRLEVVCETLLLFLQSLKDGIVTTDLWSQIEAKTAGREKARAKLTGEERQAEILDVLSSAPVHSVAFTFLTFMLTKVSSDVVINASNFTSMQNPSRVSMSSTRSSNPDVDEAMLAPNSPPSRTTRLPSFRRRNRASTSASSGGESESQPSTASLPVIQKAYARIFGGLLIQDASTGFRAKEKRATEERKSAVLESFICEMD